MKKFLVTLFLISTLGCANDPWPDATYTVDGVDIVNISYAEGNGTIVNLTNIQLPWSVVVDASKDTKFLYLHVIDSSSSCNEKKLTIKYGDGVVSEASMICETEKEIYYETIPEEDTSWI